MPLMLPVLSHVHVDLLYFLLCLIVLIHRVLLEASPQLNRLPQLWLQHVLDHMRRPDQSRDDIVRRSAGLPAAFVALFAGEPTGHPKTLLQKGMILSLQ